MTKSIRLNLIIGCALCLLLFAPTYSTADSVAHGIWGVGVQIGFAEYGSNVGSDPRFLVQSLMLARTLAIQSGCIPTDEIDRLISAMQNTTNSRTVYPDITAYRQRLASYIVNNCNCSGSTQVSPLENQQLLGRWQGCDGRVVEFTEDRGVLRGAYIALGGLGTYGFRIGQAGYEARQVSPGLYEGRVLWMGAATTPQWRPNRITIQGDDYKDTGSDSCSQNMKRVR